MSAFVEKLILSICGNNPILATILISMIPIVELRGAIPFGSSKNIWGDEALSVFEASIYSVIGSIISAVIIILLLIPIFNFLKKTKFFRRIVESFEEKFKKQSDKIVEDAQKNQNKSLKKWLGIMTFVAVPLPMTGVWTGSAVAVFLQMGFFKSFTSVAVGALIAAIIVSIVTILLGSKADLIFDIFLIIFVVLIAFYIISALVKNKKITNNVENKK